MAEPDSSIFSNEKEINEKKNKIIQTAEVRINKLNEIIQRLNLLIENEKNINELFSDDANEFKNIFQYYESWDLVCKKISDNLKELENIKDLYLLNKEEISKSISENNDFSDMIKINEKLIALRTDNLINFYEINSQSMKKFYSHSFKNSKIMSFCAYKRKDVLVYLKVYDSDNRIRLVDVKNKSFVKIFESKEKIIYLSNGDFTDNIYSILDSNELICFEEVQEIESNKKFDIKFNKKFDDGVKCLIEISENILFIGNEYGFFIYNMIYNNTISSLFKKKEKFNPNNVFFNFKLNYIFFGGKDKIYIIDSKEYFIVSKIKIEYQSLAFFDEKPFVCFYDKNNFQICEFIIELKNFYEKKKKKSEDEISSIIYISKDKLKLLVNKRNIVEYKI